jgi:glycerate kinase
MCLRLLFLAPLALVLAACQSSGGLGSGGSASGDCGAGQFQNLVGTLGDSVNRSSLPAGTRVLRPTTPMSPDYRPDRLNVYIDESGQVEKVVCG